MKPRRKWLRRFVWGLSILLFLGVVLRVALWLALPWILDSTASSLGLNAEYERLDLSIATGDMELWHFTLTPEGAEQALVEMEYCRVDLAMVATLFNWKVVGRRVEVDGMDLHLHRASDGSFPALKELLAILDSESEATPEAGEAGADLVLASPLQLDALRLQQVQLHLFDETFEPALRRRFDFDLRLSNLGSDRRRMRFNMTISSPPIIDRMSFEWTASLQDEKLDMELEGIVSGYRPERIAPYLEMVGLRPVGRKYDFGFKGRIRTAGTEQGYEAFLDLHDLVLEVDGKEHLALDRLAITADSVGFDQAQVSLVELEGGRALARRLPSGELCVMGMKLIPVESKPVKKEKPPGKASEFHWSVDRVRLANFSAKLVDESMTPSRELALALDELTLDDLAPTDQPVTIRGRLSAEDVVSAIDLDGTALPFAETKRVDLRLTMDGISPRALEPFLRQAGLESRLVDGDFSCRLSAAVHADETLDLTLAEIRYADTEELYRLEKLEVAGARFDAESVHIDRIEVEGQSFDVWRDASGTVSALGFALTGRAAPSASPDGKPAGGPPPRIAINRMSWRDHRIGFHVEGAKPFHLENLTLEASDLVVDLNEGAEPAPPGKIEMQMAIPGLAEALKVRGTVQPKPAGLAARFEVDGKAINGTAVAPFLEGAGLDPRFTDAALHVAVSTSLALSEDTLRVDVEVEGAALEQHGEVLAGVQRAKVSGVELSPGRIHVAAVEIDQPRIMAGRDADGVLHAAGVGLILKPMEPEQPPTPVSEVQPLPVIELGWLDVKDAVLKWDDRAAAPAVEASFVAGVTLENFGFRDAPADLSASLTVPETGKKINVKGTLALSPGTQRVNLELDAQGLKPGPLAAYLPPGMRCVLENGSFHARLEAGVEEHPQGGRKAELLVTDVAYLDGAPLLALDSARATLSRLDLDSGVVALGELSLHGFETAVQKTESGAMRLLGLELVPVEKKQEEAPPRPPDQKRLREKLPLLTLDKLDLNLSKLTFHDLSRAGSEPLVLSGFRFSSRAPIELLGDQPENRPPLDLVLEGKIDPLVDSLHVGITASPFASPAELKAALDVKGIQGEGITRIEPGLAPMIDGALLTDGRLTGTAELDVNAKRRGALDMHWLKKFGFDLEIKDAAFRNGEDGEVLAGLDELLVNVDELDTATGDVHIRAIEMIKPRARVSREEDGLHVLDLVFKIPESRQEEEAAATEPLARAGPEISVDRIWISGVDFTALDLASTPPMTVPLTDLDFEVEGFTTRAFTEPRPIRFNMLLNAGKVMVPASEEERPLFEEITASGRLVFYPMLEGWVKTGVSALEVTGFRGPAMDSGVELNDGVFDASVDVRFQEDGTMSTSAKLLFTDLSLSESDDGPITRFLKLPASLDTVLFVLRDEDGAIEIPLDFEMSEDGLSMGQITTTAVTTLTMLIADAVANAPFRVVGTVGSLGSLVLGGEEESKSAGDPLTLAFAPGTVVPGSTARRELDLLTARMQDEDDLVLTLRHELGGGDLAEAYLRANPSPADCAGLITRLKARRVELLRDRADTASRARAAYASAFESECAAQTKRLQEIDRELGLLEQSLDRVLELMRPGAERQAVRRARDVCIAIGSARLAAVLEAMKEAGVENADERIRITRPRYTEAEGASGGVVTLTPGRKKVQ